MSDVYTEFSGLAELRNKAQQHDPDALRAAASQFEALFLQMTLKSMRESVSKSSLFNSNESEFYNGLFDQQLALQMGGISNLGIADLVYKQLGGSEQGQDVDHGKRFEDYMFDANPASYSVNNAINNAPLTGKWIGAEGVQKSKAERTDSEPWRDANEFVQRLKPAAIENARKLNVSPEAILAVTALETGWGSHVIKRNEGGSSFNLFGIKATPDWHGESVVASTLEFANGVMNRRQELFRSYQSVEDSVADFAKLIKYNPRYKNALNTGMDTNKFFLALQQGGYATDPNYATKLSEVICSKPMELSFKK
jgi:flagellar protein FlgJ